MWIVFSVYDKKACEYGQLYLARKEQVAARMFADAITAENTLGKYPEDFCLMAVGQFDETEGLVEPFVGGPAMVVEALSVLALRNGGSDAG